MKYINKKTQAVIETACVIRGKNWKPLKESKKTEKASEEEENKEQPKEK